jgi:hypothetical protein
VIRAGPDGKQSGLQAFPAYPSARPAARVGSVHILGKEVK